MLVVMNTSHVRAIPKIEVCGASDFSLLIARVSIYSKMCCISRAPDVLMSTVTSSAPLKYAILIMRWSLILLVSFHISSERNHQSKHEFPSYRNFNAQWFYLYDSSYKFICIFRCYDTFIRCPLSSKFVGGGITHHLFLPDFTTLFCHFFTSPPFSAASKENFCCTSSLTAFTFSDSGWQKS